jgi:NADPH-dependent 2,4-dienoyl-CoA reductase/sulfur reductase-like enzyme
MERILIAGNGYAGVAAAKALSSERGFSVTLVSAEPCAAYIPHLLPELAAGRKEAADLLLLDPDAYASLGVRLVNGTGVVSLSAGKRQAVLSNGETLAFDKALIATGAKAWIPQELQEIAARCRNVLTMKRLIDALTLRKLMTQGAARIVIVGAGRVGMLLAEALRDTGVRVDVVEIGPAILATMLQPDVAERLAPVLRSRRHLTLHTGVGIVSFAEDGGNVRELRLSDGTTLPCDVAVIATGVEPNAGFLSDLPADAMGIPVDRGMRTREAGIFAAGDVVRFETITGREEPGQLAVNARAQGEAAAMNMAGRNVLCPPSFVGNIVKLDPIVAARIGDVDGSDHADTNAGNGFVRVTLESGKATGLQFIGPPEDMRGLAPAVIKKFGREEVRDLLEGRLDLGFAPLLAARGYPWA